MKNELLKYENNRMESGDVLVQKIRFDALLHTIDFVRLGRIILKKDLRSRSGYAFVNRYLAFHGIRATMYRSGEERKSYGDLIRERANGEFFAALRKI